MGINLMLASLAHLLILLPPCYCRMQMNPISEFYYLSAEHPNGGDRVDDCSKSHLVSVWLVQINVTLMKHSIRKWSAKG